MDQKHAYLTTKSEYTPTNALIRPEEDGDVRVRPDSRIEDVGRQERSNAYEVGLIDN